MLSPGSRLAMTLALVFALCGNAFAEIYKWTDANGRVHFGDRDPNAKPVAAATPAIPNRPATPVSAPQTRMAATKPSAGTGYSLYINDPGSVLDDAARERLEAGVEKIVEIYTGLFHLHFRRQVNIEISVFATHREFAAELARRGMQGPIPRALLGIFIPGDNFVGGWKHDEDMNEVVATLLHESSHVLVGQLAPNAPSWLQEGLAQYFEGIDPDADGYVIAPKADTLEAINVWTRNRQLVTLNQYFSLSEERWRHLAHAENNPVPYVVAWSVAYFLMGKPVGRQIIGDLLQNMEIARRLPTADAIERRYPGGYALMEYDWFKWAQGDKPAQNLRW